MNVEAVWREVAERILQDLGPEWYVRHMVTRTPSGRPKGVRCHFCGQAFPGWFQQIEVARDNNETRRVLAFCWDRDACDAQAFKKAVRS